jgi:hypothetical protein
VYTAVVALFQRTFGAISGQGSDLAVVMTLFVLAHRIHADQEHTSGARRPSHQAEVRTRDRASGQHRTTS